MRIDGMGTDALQAAGSRAQAVSPGDVIQGRVIANDNGQLEMRLSDGSTLHARVAEGVALDAGTVVRLQIGERQDGIPTAQVLARLPAGGPQQAAAQTPAQLIGDALRALGEKAVPQLVDRALQLVQQTGMPEDQAAFLAANAFEGADPATSILGRMLEGQYEFGANWRALAGGMADAVAGLPQAARDALLTQQGQATQLGALADGLLEEAAAKLAGQGAEPGTMLDSVLTRNGVALSAALRDALGTLAGTAQTPQTALATLQQSLMEIPGGRVLLSLLLSGTGEGQMPAADAAAMNAGATGTMPGVAEGTASGTAPGTTPGTAAGTAEGGVLPQPAAGTGGTPSGLVTADGTAANSAIPAGATPGAETAIPAGTLAGALPEGAQGQADTAQAGTSGTAGSVGSPGAAGAFPLDARGTNALMDLLTRVSTALQQGTAEGATPEQTRAAVLSAFDQAVARAGAEQAGATPRDVDVGKMAQSIRDQLEWTSQALSRMDADTAAAMRPMLQDATAAMRLFNQVSTYQAFVQVPLQINGQDARGELYVMKRKGKRGRIDASDFTLFLALDTEHLGHMETLAHARNRQVTLQFRVPDETVQDLLRDLKPTLYEGLEKKGFRLVDLKVRTSKEEPISVLTALKAAEERLGRTGGVDVRL